MCGHDRFFPIRNVVDIVADIATSEAVRLVNEHTRDDAHRIGTSNLCYRLTIGVLTKADRVQVGEELGWLPVLNNAERKIRYGYYLTSQPSTIQRQSGKFSWEKSRLDET